MANPAPKLTRQETQAEWIACGLRNPNAPEFVRELATATPEEREAFALAATNEAEASLARGEGRTATPQELLAGIDTELGMAR